MLPVVLSILLSNRWVLNHLSVYPNICNSTQTFYSVWMTVNHCAWGTHYVIIVMMVVINFLFKHIVRTTLILVCCTCGMTANRDSTVHSTFSYLVILISIMYVIIDLHCNSMTSLSRLYVCTHRYVTSLLYNHYNK